MSFKRGPLETAVWDGVKLRPAGIVHALDRRAKDCFAALFNGAGNGWKHKPDACPSFGKAEAEWAWPDGWNKLKELGLVEWTETERPCHPSFGDVPPMVDIVWRVTEKGWAVRYDDLEWFRELMDARDQDEKSGALAP